jgi:uncharacterized coiled-coil protein SlyX
MRFGFLAAVAARVVRGRQFARIIDLLEKIMSTQADIVKEIADAKAEISAKITSLSDQLATAVANQTNVTPELQSAADDLKAYADGLTPPPAPPAPPAA